MFSFAYSGRRCFTAILAGRTMQAEDGREVPGLEGKRLLAALEQVGWKAQG